MCWRYGLREDEERERQPRGRRKRTDEAQHRVNPVADGARPAGSRPGGETRSSAKKIAARQQVQRGEDAFAEPGPILDYDFQKSLRRRKKRHRKQVELCRSRLPSA